MKTQPTKSTFLIWATKYKQYFPELCPASNYAYLTHLVWFFFFFNVAKALRDPGHLIFEASSSPKLDDRLLYSGEDYWGLFYTFVESDRRNSERVNLNVSSSLLATLFKYTIPLVNSLSVIDIAGK
jgi:hypothetical protein